jgi:hypothetical protein
LEHQGFDWGMWIAPFSSVPHRQTAPLTIWICLGMLLTGRAVSLRAAETNLAVQVQELLQDNSAMRAQMQKQQELIDTLTHEVAKIRKVETERDGESRPSGVPESTWVKLRLATEAKITRPAS